MSSHIYGADLKKGVMVVQAGGGHLTEQEHTCYASGCCSITISYLPIAKGKHIRENNSWEKKVCDEISNNNIWHYLSE